MYKYKCMHQLLKLKNINMIKKTQKIMIYMYIVYLKAEFENRFMFNCSCGRLNIHYSENFLIVRKCHLYAPGAIICSWDHQRLEPTTNSSPEFIKSGGPKDLTSKIYQRTDTIF